MSSENRMEMAGECWPWPLYVRDDGYAVHRGEYAHRKMYERFFDVEIPKKMTVDHLCRNKSCVNPWHMEIVTNRENVIRAWNVKVLRMTHCQRGHAFDEENTYHRPGGQRTCRACYTASRRAWYEKNKKEINRRRMEKKHG